MSVLEIVKIGSENENVLYQIAKEINIIEDRHKILANDMLETMIKANGMGLAANQIGVLERIITLLLPKGEFLVMINPVIIKTSDTKISKYAEGCLSIPNRSGRVDRYSEVTIEYKTLEGNIKKENFTGLTAVCIQHEMDHLNGILFTSKIKKLKKV